MRRSEEGGYDTWGVTLPGGKVREFGTLKKAAMFAQHMEGKTILDRNHEPITWTGLTVVHRYIPTWSPVTNVDELLATCPLCGASDPRSQAGAAKFCSHGFHAPPGGTRDA